MNEIEIDVCENIDFSPLVPDDPQPPLCKLGHEWLEDCMKPNSCPDYEHGIAYSWEDVKKELHIE